MNASRDPAGVRPLPLWKRWATACLDAAAALSRYEYRFELVGVMTVLLLLLYSESVWYLQFGVYGVALLMLAYRPLLHSRILWFVVLLLLTVGHLRLWVSIDNHKYLITYWCLAIFLSLLAPTPVEALRKSARLLIGLAFLFAVVGKLLAPDYLDGTFFQGTLLTDSRFFGVASFFGNIPVRDLHMAALAQGDLRAFGDLSVPLDVPQAPVVVVLAQVLTWWTVLIEALIAVLFLWPEDQGISRWRDPALLIFMVTTYPVAPVVGFAWVLSAMGAAQSTRQGFRYWPAVYLFAFLFVYLVKYLPFARVFLE